MNSGELHFLVRFVSDSCSFLYDHLIELGFGIYFHVIVGRASNIGLVSHVPSEKLGNAIQSQVNRDIHLVFFKNSIHFSKIRTCDINGDGFEHLTSFICLGNLPADVLTTTPRLTALFCN